MSLPSYRRLNFLAAIACLLLLAVGYYLQYTKNLQPCSLCVLQRGVFLCIAIILFLTIIHYPKHGGRRIYGTLITLFSLAGVLLAARQVWLHTQPASSNVCLPGLSYLISHYPITKAFSLVLQGSPDCGIVTWRLLGLSIPEWSLLCFIGLGLLGLIQIFSIKKPS